MGLRYYDANNRSCRGNNSGETNAAWQTVFERDESEMIEELRYKYLYKNKYNKYKYCTIKVLYLYLLYHTVQVQ